MRRQERNTEKKEAYRVLLRKIEKSVSAGKLDGIDTALSAFYKAIDKAAKTHVIAKNKASRLKSRAAKLTSGAHKK